MRSPAARTSSVTWLPVGMLAAVDSLSAPLSVATIRSPSVSRPCTRPLMMVPLSSCASVRGGSGITAVKTLGAGPAVGSLGGRLIENSLIVARSSGCLRELLGDRFDVARGLATGMARQQRRLRADGIAHLRVAPHHAEQRRRDLQEGVAGLRQGLVGALALRLAGCSVHHHR